MTDALRESIARVPWRRRDGLLLAVVPWIVLPIAAVIVLRILAPFIPGGSNYLHQVSNDTPQAAFSLYIVTAVGSVAMISYYLRSYRATWRDLGIRGFNIIKFIGYLLLVIFAFGLLVSLAYWLASVLVPNFNAQQAQTNEFTGQTNLLSLFALVILPPFIEEPVFRGFLFPAFAKYHGIVGGAVISSILFGLAHWQANVSVYTFILGLLLCWLYRRTGSIIPGIAVHLLNNYVAYTAIK